MLVQLLKIGEESSFNNEEDKERLEGMVFYVKDKSQIEFLDRSWEGKRNVNFLGDVELIVHKDIKNLYFLDKYSFYDVEYKILRM